MCQTGCKRLAGNHLKQLESWDSLLVYAETFSSVRNNDELSKLELLEIYIWLDKQPKWEPIVNEIIKIHSSQNSIKKVIQKLINNGKHDFAYQKLKSYRKSSNLKDFYSFEMGMFFTMRMAFDKGLDEYLLYLSNHPNQYQNISNRIMAFPNTEEITRTTINTLKSSDTQTAQYILADVKFKLKEYNSGYEILQSNNAPSEVLMNYAEDLFLVRENRRQMADFGEYPKNPFFISATLQDAKAIMQACKGHPFKAFGTIFRFP